MQVGRHPVGRRRNQLDGGDEIVVFVQLVEVISGRRLERTAVDDETDAARTGRVTDELWIRKCREAEAGRRDALRSRLPFAPIGSDESGTNASLALYKAVAIDSICHSN